MNPILPLLLSLSIQTHSDPITDTGNEAPLHAEFAARAAALASVAEPDTLTRERLAFLALDRLTHCGYLHECARLDGAPEADRLAKSIEVTTRYLMARVLARVAAFHDGRAFAPHLPQPPRETLARVEVAFRTALQSSFAVPSGTGSVPFAQAFLDFSSGILRESSEGRSPTGEIHGGPNGPYHFAFMEAGLLFVEQNLEPDFWRTLLPGLLAGSQAFVATHWNGAGRARADYEAPEVLPVRAMGAEHEATAFTTFDALVAFALADEHGVVRCATRRNAIVDQVEVGAGLFMENPSEPGKYLPVDPKDPAFEDEEFVSLLAKLDGSYVEYFEDGEQQSETLLELLEQTAADLPVTGGLIYEGEENSKYDSYNKDWNTSIYQGCIVVPYKPPAGSVLDPEARYFVNLWTEL